MYKRCWIVLYGIFYIEVIDLVLSQQKGLNKNVNLALETVFEFDKNGKLDIQLLNNVQKFIDKVKNVLEKKHTERRQTGTDQRNVFTNFILNIVNVLNKFEDNDLERFFDIINNEIQSYYDKDDDIHIINKLSSVGNMPAYGLRRYLNAITNKIEGKAYFEDEKAVIDGVNNIFKLDDTTKFDNFINNLENYRQKSRRDIDLGQVIKLGLRNIFLHSYYHLKPSTRTVLRTILHYYFGSFTPLTTKYPVFQQSNSVKRAKSKTTRESRTWRQMYVEKNLDLKYPNDYVPITKKHKRKDKIRTKKKHVMTVPTTRATIKSTHRKGKKYSKVKEYNINIDTSKHTENSDDETTIIKTTKMIDEYVYKRDFNKKYEKQSNQYSNSKEYDEDEEKHKAHRNLNKLSTFYLDLSKISATNNAKQRFDTRTHEYERPVVRPTGFTISIKNGNHWNSRQKVKKSKHYGYIQKKRKDVFTNKQQKHMNKKDPEMVRMPPISLNMQLSTTKEPSKLDNGFEDTTLGVEYLYRNQDIRSPLSEEGLSIEDFQETKRKLYNRRSENHNNAANNKVLNLIQKIEQDLEAVKTKIHNVSVFKNENNLDDIIKITENDVNKLKAGINMDKSINQESINLSKFYEEQDRYDLENEEKNYSCSDEKVTFESTGVNEIESIHTAARKTIYDQKWYPLVRAREVKPDERIIQRKDSPTKNEVTYDFLINEGNSITTINIFKGKTKNEKLEHTTVIKKIANTKVYDNAINLNRHSKEKTLHPNLEDKAFGHNKVTVKEMNVIYKANDDKTLPKKNVKLTEAKFTNDQNTKENATKQNISIEPNTIKDEPNFRSQMDKMNTLENMTIKQITTTKSDIKTTSITNCKNTTKSAVTINNFNATQKATDVALNENKFKKTVFNEIDQQHVGINNKNVTMIPKLDELKETTTVKTVD